MALEVGKPRARRSQKRMTACGRPREDKEADREAQEGVIKFGAKVLLGTPQPSILPDGKKGRADYNPLRRGAVLPILPAALFRSTA